MTVRCFIKLLKVLKYFKKNRNMGMNLGLLLALIGGIPLLSYGGYKLFTVHRIILIRHPVQSANLSALNESTAICDDNSTADSSGPLTEASVGQIHHYECHFCEENMASNSDEVDPAGDQSFVCKRCDEAYGVTPSQDKKCFKCLECKSKCSDFSRDCSSDEFNKFECSNCLQRKFLKCSSE